MDTLRQTQTGNPPMTPMGRRTFDPTDLFARRDALPRFWFFVALAVSLLAAWDRHQVISRFKARERVVIIDPAGTYYLSPLFQFEEARDLHVQQAELATLAFLQRNPKGFDSPDLLSKLFLKPALDKAFAQRQRESPEFRAKSLHQKPEIGRIEVLSTREAEVLVNVTGQLVRSGVFQDKPFTEGVPFSLKLRLLRNPKMADNGRFPTAVAEFTYENRL